MTLENLTVSAVQLLKDLIEIPSFSSEEHLTAARIEAWFTSLQQDIDQRGDLVEHSRPFVGVFFQNTGRCSVGIFGWMKQLKTQACIAISVVARIRSGANV